MAVDGCYRIIGHESEWRGEMMWKCFRWAHCISICLPFFFMSLPFPSSLPLLKFAFFCAFLFKILAPIIGVWNELLFLRIYFFRFPFLA
jgi:hypothetical protein